MVSDENFFLFSPLLHEVAMGRIETRHIAYPIRRLHWRDRFNFLQGTVQTIDLNRHTVITTAGPIEYDYLVLALGGAPDLSELPALGPNVFTLKSLDDSVRIRNHIIKVFEQALVESNQEKRKSGSPLAAARSAREIQRLFSSRGWVYRDPRELVVCGRVALLGGMDPKMVLDQLYDRVKKSNPKLREVYLATGDLALEKHDFALAARVFQEGLKQLPDDPDLHFGLARAYAPSDQKLMLASLTTALEKNSRHVGSLLLLADHNIDAEDYAAAGKFLDRVEAINPWQPDGWAYRAVICHLRNQLDAEEKAREKALKFWATNPRVDYLIGLKLSQKYRFSIGATHQKRSLSFDPTYLPAKSQLAQDLLRLGEEAEGWRQQWLCCTSLPDRYLLPSISGN